MFKMNLLKLTIVAITIVIGIDANAQITAKEAVIKMGRGINLGNTLDALNYEGEWAPVAQEKYFEMYAEAGFKTIRIPITWNKRIGTEAPYTIDPDFLKRVDTIVNWCLDRDMYAIINVHHDKWLKSKDTFDEQKPRFYALWEQLADHYKDYPEKLIFEILNEPHHEDANGNSNSLTQVQVDEVNKKGLEIIRVANPTRIAIFGGKQWSGAWDLTAAAVPDTADRYLMGYYHSYDPYNFAHKAEGTWGTLSDKEEMVSQMEMVREWSEDNNVPVLIGEFGAFKECDYNSRSLWYEHYVASALSKGFAFAAWDDNGNFQILERSKDSDIVTWGDVKDILIYSSDSSVTNLKTEIVEDTVIQLKWEARSNSELVSKVVIERRSLNTEFAPIAEFSMASSTTVPNEYLDKNAPIGEYSYYRVVEEYSNTKMPSYPIREFKISVDRSPYDGAIDIPGTLEAENFDIGGQFNSYYDNEIENLGGAYRFDEWVDVQERADGGRHVGYVEKGEWIEYTVNVAQDGEYEFIARVASDDNENGEGQFQLMFDGTRYSKFITTPLTGGWEKFEEVSGKVTLNAGEQIMRITFTGEGAVNVDNIVFRDYVSVKDDQQQVAVYPNPATNLVHIILPEGGSNKFDVYNGTGKLVLSKVNIDKQTVVNVSDFENGVYFIVINNKNGLIKNTFIKQ